MKQPTLSRRLRDLEYKLGVTLFERTNGGTRPTIEGQEFLDDAQRILDETEAITVRVKNHSRGESGQLTIGVHASLSAGNFRGHPPRAPAPFPRCRYTSKEIARQTRQIFRMQGIGRRRVSPAGANRQGRCRARQGEKSRRARTAQMLRRLTSRRGALRRSFGEGRQRRADLGRETAKFGPHQAHCFLHRFDRANRGLLTEASAGDGGCIACDGNEEGECAALAAMQPVNGANWPEEKDGFSVVEETVAGSFRLD
ncbi:LysR family transcriptional regulator [Bradyrhizobium cytisi]|uniref:LysR family transcriptional regulator n=1 Tax=Bradyrhizobium cytisi TaxID=515489 RepID=UPI003221C390